MKNTIIISIIAMTVPGVVAAAEETQSPLKKVYHVGEITTVKSQISDILRMSFTGHTLAVDRRHWKRAASKQSVLIKGKRVFDHQIYRQAAPGGNETLTILINRLRAAAGARGLPGLRPIHHRRYGTASRW